MYALTILFVIAAGFIGYRSLITMMTMAITMNGARTKAIRRPIEVADRGGERRGIVTSNSSLRKNRVPSSTAMPVDWQGKRGSSCGGSSFS